MRHGMIAVADRPTVRYGAVLDLAVRVVVAAVGGYGVTYALTAALATGLAGLLGLDRVDAAIISTNCGFLAFPAVVIWSFAVRRLRLMVLVPVLVGAGLWIFAWSVRP
jgi:hypothetical protein